MNHRLTYLAISVSCVEALTDPRPFAWYVADSGQSARIYRSTAAVNFSSGPTYTLTGGITIL